MLTIMALLTMIMTMTLMIKNTSFYLIINLSQITSMNLSLELIFNWQTLAFSFTVTTISSMIMIYSKSYISKESMNLLKILMYTFISSMIILIHSNNLFLTILGWDGLGLSSYLLVMFYQNSSSSSAASITMLTNRIGDIMLIISTALMMSSGIWTITSKNTSSLTLILMMIASTTKSAQFPFMAWLPAAMAAPTPVSALVHSSTLVTAGVILMIRLSNVIHPMTMNSLLIMSLVTSVLSSLSALWEMDLKKIIALSTLSQVAFMMMAISLNMPTLALFHLITHAFFKATMFMCVGYMIHLTSYQDSRSIKILQTSSPTINSTLGITSMALSGLPFTTGFYSKDMILETFASTKSNSMIFNTFIMTITLTTMYNLRMMTMSMSPKLTKSPDIHLNHNKTMITSIMMMTPMSIIMGSTLSWMSFPMNTFTPSTIKMIPLITIITATIIISSALMKMPNSQIPQSMWMLNWTSYKPFINLTTLGSKSLQSDNTWNESPSLSMKNTMPSMSKKLFTKTHITLLLLIITIPSIL